MKKGIIVASFGTTFEDTRKKSIEPIENKVSELFGNEYRVTRSFTSHIVVKRLKEKYDIHVLNIKDAIEDMKNNGVDDIYIAPLHIIKGYEYEKLLNLGAKVGKPLLTDEKDFIKIAQMFHGKNLDKSEAIVFMGHGSKHDADITYERLQTAYNETGSEKVFIGTVEGEITLDDIMIKLEKLNIKKVKLMPFMLVAGDHAINDMASDDDNSWKSILLANGYEVETIVKGLGENKDIQDMYIDHLKELLEA